MESLIWKSVASVQHKCSEANFWEAVKIWNKSPNLISKRIFGVNLLHLGDHNNLNLFHEVLSEVHGKTTESATNYFISKAKSTDLTCNNENESISCNLRYRLFAKIILHKRKISDAVEVTLLDLKEKQAIFVEPVSQQFAYTLQYEEGLLVFKIPENSSMDVEWYKSIFLPKLAKWMSNCCGVYSSSISLVSIDQYKSLYTTLKTKYISDIWQIWTEVTDPEKFIHEDIAIATYLLLLWRGKPPQRYVDLGCGNGLLVHILNSESHLGVGYDLRARKIWAKYPSTTVLKVQQIKPTRDQMFEEVDWIIGNHSDELTPWIPVIATYNSPRCNFFLLPCCAYHFDGSKFRRSNSSKSLYNDYLDYVENVCTTCGFNVHRDKLRIPSTKRVCFVSNGRYHDMENFNQFKIAIDSLIEESSDKVDQPNKDWNIEVRLRDSEEKVRNCTQIDSNLKQDIVRSLAEILLKEGTVDGIWNEGKPTSIEEVIRIIPSQLLKELKNEGKGLQTLIKNHHHIFILENGVIKFRKPSPSQLKTKHWKTKECWFYSNHPNSCPLSESDCSYCHFKD